MHSNASCGFVRLHRIGGSHKQPAKLDCDELGSSRTAARFGNARFLSGILSNKVRVRT